MPDVFISYSRKDRDFVASLAQALRTAKRDVWVDLDDILQTEDWLKKIFRGIDAANHFVVVLSPDNISSEICCKELAYAVQANKRIIPILFRDLGALRAPDEVARLNWLFYTDRDNLDDWLPQLLQAIDIDPEWVNLHTHFQVRARDWENGGRDASFALRGIELQTAVRWLGDAAKHKHSQPTRLQNEFIQASQKVEADEMARFKQLYRTALARQLAAQAELARQQQGHLIELSVLLAVESLHCEPSPQGAESLRRGLALLPPVVASLQTDDRVVHLQFSPDGSVLGAASANAVHLWSLPQGQRIGTLPHPSQVNALAFDVSGRFLATGCGDYSGKASFACVFDLQTGQPVLQFPHPDMVKTVAWNPDERHLTSGGADGFLRIWDLRSGRAVYQLKVTSQIDCLAYSPKGDLLACAGMFDSAVLIYPAGFNQPPRRLPHDGADRVNAIAFSPDGTLLAAVDGFNVAQSSTIPIRIWDLKSASLNRILYLRDVTYGVFSVAFASNGRQVLAPGGDQTARVISLDGEREVARLPHAGIVQAVASSDSQQWMATGGDDRHITVWPTWNGREVATTEVLDCCDPRNAFAFALHPHRNIGALAVWDFRLVDLTSGKILAKMDLGNLALGVSFSPDGKALAISGKTESVAIFETEGLKRLALLAHPEFVSDSAFDGSGKTLATAGWDGQVRLFDVATSAEQMKFTTDAIVSAVAFSRDGKYVAAATQSNWLLVWEVATGREVLRHQMNDIPWDVEFDASGRRIVTAGDGVRVWDLNDNSSVVLWPGKASTATFNSDRNLVAAAADGAGVWDLSSQREIAHIPHVGSVRHVAFDHQNRFLITTSKLNIDCIIRIWFLNTDDLIGEASSRVTRRLTREEWNQYLPGEPYNPTA